jgi:hypothetical protein
VQTWHGLENARESPAAIDTESIVDPALHHEIKCRAYDLYKRHGNTVDGRDSHDELPSELPRVAYAAAQLQMYLEGEVGDTQSRRSGTGVPACSNRFYCWLRCCPTA